MGDELWGEETRKAIENFPVSGEPMPIAVIHWLARIKGAAASVNHELGLLDADRAERIVAAAAAVAAGHHDDQFPVDVFQTGSGTSTNMNVNEVVATLAGSDVHPNDHVNLGQSSNDVVPSAVHLSALEACEQQLLPALSALATEMRHRAEEFDELPKAGRTHLMDAVPITLGQEFGGYRAQVAEGVRRITSALDGVRPLPLGGTATGTGLGTHPEFATRVRDRLTAEGAPATDAPIDRFEAQAARDGLVELSGALKVLAVSFTKIANDLALLASGPRGGLGEIELPALQKGSSIMPGKVNPVIPEVVLQVAAQVVGNDTAITVGGMQGNFELNVRVPLIGRNLLQSIRLLANAAMLLNEKCVAGVRPNVDRLRWLADHTLAAATALNPVVGYDAASAIVNDAVASGRSLREVALEHGVDADVLDRTLDPIRLAQGGLQ
ncbi:MAG: class II fumarate hydratase [Acidimicrobiales bacterium]|nr:class II fumarate hydratase [Acidimicrobiales bacterium]